MRASSLATTVAAAVTWLAASSVAQLDPIVIKVRNCEFVLYHGLV